VSVPTVIPPGGGEVVGDSPERRVEILSDHDALHATWTRYGPRRDGADLHVHRRHTDLFYVLAGELTLRLGPEGRPLRMPAGTLVRIPPLVVHGFRNDTDAELRYLNFHAPGRGFADFLRALRDGRTLAYDQHEPPADGGRPITEAVVGSDAFGDAGDIAIAEVSTNGEAPARPHGQLRSLYVLERGLTVTAGERELRAPVGSWVQVPPGIPHAIAGPARYLDVRTPGLTGT
jgi:quercetin dioxygenase-like cupin family protein